MLFAAVPVKALEAAKSRLQPTLSVSERAELAADMLAGVLHALAGSGIVAATAVVSPDPTALAIAERTGATGLRQTDGGLNTALDQARTWAIAGGADTLLVLLGDLPLLRPADIQAMAEMAADPIRGEPVVVLAPDRHGHGTNALLLRPPGTLAFGFGEDSYDRHFWAAAAGGAEIMVYRSTGTAFDLDTAEDLAALAALS
ncbi:MAG TPA: 2-phospho-L-lactate guanylyltransferase [Chloroflexia bacterium]|nr:2-phospho-L-lactate guanylyltransferase [Chloroflexia bacterium]